MTDRGISKAEVAGTRESLTRLAGQFRDAADRYAAWASREQEHEPTGPRTGRGLLSVHSYTAGKSMHEIAATGQLRLPRLPEKLLREPTGFDEIGEEGVFHDLWWLAFVGWLETSPLIDFSPRSTPSYPSRVFYVWNPGTPIGAWRSDIDSEPPFAGNWLCYSTELCEEYGQDACLQSAAAIEYLVERNEIEPGDKAGSTIRDRARRQIDDVSGGETPAHRRPRITRDEANIVARELLRSDAGFARKTLREWADSIRCSVGLAAQLPVWKAVMERRRKEQKAKKPTVVGLTDKVLAVTGRDNDPSEDADTVEIMRTLIEKASPKERARLNNLSPEECRSLADQYASQLADTEPSPIEDDLPDACPKRVRTRKTL